MADEQKTYFATKSGKELGDALFEKKREYERFIQQSGLVNLWRKIHWRFYGADPNSREKTTGVDRTGEQGELHLLVMNHLRADITLWLNLATGGQRSEMEPMATADDYEAEMQIKRAKAALEWFNNNNKVEEMEALAIESAGVYGMGFIAKLWDINAGTLVMPGSEAGSPAPIDPNSAETPESGALPEGIPAESVAGEATPDIFSGAGRVFHTTPMDTFFDPRGRGPELDWVMIRVWMNRFDLAAQYPAMADRILNSNTKENEPDSFSQNVDLLGIARSADTQAFPDQVPVFIFFHEDKPALKNGKIAMLLNPDCVLFEGPLRPMYPRMPVRRLACSEIHRTPFGFSPAWGLLAPQEAQSSLSSIALTNMRTFGLGTILVPKGSDLDSTDVVDGLKLIEYPMGLEKPTSLAMPTTPQELFAFRQALIGEMGTLIGVNSVVRGDPEASLKSGSALALVQATAVQFSSDFQAAIIRWKEDHHFDTVAMLQQNLDEKIEPELAGNYEASLLDAFTGADFKKVTKIKVRTVNPMMKTLAGKVQIAETMLEKMPGVFSPGDYMRVLETGSLEFMTRAATQRARNLDRENELLAAGYGPIKPEPQMGPDGRPILDPVTGQPVLAMPAPNPDHRYVRALITDDHRAHVMKHLEVLENPAVRESQDPAAQAVIDAVLSHIEEHEALAIQGTTQRLTMLELTGQQPLQSALPPPMPAPDGKPPKEDGPPKKEGGGGSPPKSAGSSAPSMQPTPAGANEQPRAAQMPVNPSTGQRVENTPGPV